MVRVLVGGDAEEFIDGDEPIALLDQGVDGQLDGADGLDAGAATSIEAVVEDQDGAGISLSERAPGDATGGWLEDLCGVGEYPGDRTQRVAAQGPQDAGSC